MADSSEAKSYTYVAQRMCPFSLSGDSKNVHLYMEDAEIQSTRDPAAISKHFKCTDVEVEKQRQIVFAEQDREKERQRQMEELERVEQSAPMVAAERIVQKISELGLVRQPVDPPEPAQVEAKAWKNPVEPVDDPVTSGAESTSVH